MNCSDSLILLTAVVKPLFGLDPRYNLSSFFKLGFDSHAASFLLNTNTTTRLGAHQLPQQLPDNIPTTTSVMVQQPPKQLPNDATAISAVQQTQKEKQRQSSSDCESLQGDSAAATRRRDEASAEECSSEASSQSDQSDIFERCARARETARKLREDPDLRQGGIEQRRLVSDSRQRGISAREVRK